MQNCCCHCYWKLFVHGQFDVCSNEGDYFENLFEGDLANFEEMVHDVRVCVETLDHSWILTSSRHTSGGAATKKNKGSPEKRIATW